MTNALVSTPNVTGNIGSCTTQVVTQAVSRDSFFTGTWKDIATNSCTGQVRETTYWQLTSDSSYVFIPLVCIAFFLSIFLFFAVFNFFFD